MDPSHHDPIYFLGIGGTGMASTAGLAKAAGYKVIGSDANLYPPMSTMLEDLNITVKTPYSAKNLENLNPQMVVVANALSRGHEELEEVLGRGLPYTSFPQFLGEAFLKDRVSVVVSGTHGKTTTASIMAYLLSALGHDPGYMIGGIPRNFTRSFNLGKGSSFVIEGDEYDTAFFDKNSKFLHYHPQFLILNNLEFDHADIFPNLAAIESQFHQLIKLVAKPENIIANIDDKGVSQLLEQADLSHKVCRVSAYGQTSKADYRLENLSFQEHGKSSQLWTLQMESKLWGPLEIKTKLAGPHNAANIVQVIACLGQLCQAKILAQPEGSAISKIMTTFEGVARRMDHLGSVAGIDIFEDFAHHPTAVAKVLQGMRTAYPSRRLLVAYEPKNATSRRNIFTTEFVQALGLGDLVYLGECAIDQRIPADQRMDTTVIAKTIGARAKAFTSNTALSEAILEDSRPGDVIVFMSSGSFSGIQYQLRERIEKRYHVASFIK